MFCTTVHSLRTSNITIERTKATSKQSGNKKIMGSCLSTNNVKKLSMVQPRTEKKIRSSDHYSSVAEPFKKGSVRDRKSAFRKALSLAAKGDAKSAYVAILCIKEGMHALDESEMNELENTTGLLGKLTETALSGENAGIAENVWAFRSFYDRQFSKSCASFIDSRDEKDYSRRVLNYVSIVDNRSKRTAHAKFKTLELDLWSKLPIKGVWNLEPEDYIKMLFVARELQPGSKLHLTGYAPNARLSRHLYEVAAEHGCQTAIRFLRNLKTKTAGTNASHARQLSMVEIFYDTFGSQFDPRPSVSDSLGDRNELQSRLANDRAGRYICEDNSKDNSDIDPSVAMELSSMQDAPERACAPHSTPEDGKFPCFDSPFTAPSSARQLAPTSLALAQAPARASAPAPYQVSVARPLCAYNEISSMNLIEFSLTVAEFAEKQNDGDADERKEERRMSSPFPHIPDLAMKKALDICGELADILPEDGQLAPRLRNQRPKVKVAFA